MLFRTKNILKPAMLLAMPIKRSVVEQLVMSEIQKSLIAVQELMKLKFVRHEQTGQRHGYEILF
jgi:hypothetical protein